MTFPCTMCGLCCKNIKNVKELDSFKMDNGVCKNYNQSSGCMIYQTRPLICRVQEGYFYFFKDTLTLSQYYEKNKDACNYLQEKAGLDISFRVVLK